MISINFDQILLHDSEDIVEHWPAYLLIHTPSLLDIQVSSLVQFNQWELIIIFIKITFWMNSKHVEGISFCNEAS